MRAMLRGKARSAGGCGGLWGLQGGRLRCFVVGKDAALCKDDARVAVAARLHPHMFSLQQHMFVDKELHVNGRFHEKVSPLK